MFGPADHNRLALFRKHNLYRSRVGRKGSDLVALVANSCSSRGEACDGGTGNAIVDSRDCDARIFEFVNGATMVRTSEWSVVDGARRRRSHLRT